MLVIITENYEAMSRQAAAIVAQQIHDKGSSVLGLATGATPRGTYAELIHRHREKRLDFASVVTFNLDEYLGIRRDHTHSFYREIHEQFLDHVNIHERNVHVPYCAESQNVQQCCLQYENAIQQAGGIDLQILGIGKSGHIGFNEPSSSLGSRTRVKTLTQQTIQDQQRIFGQEPAPILAVTMGIGTILEARRILLLASGNAKADAIARAIEGPVTSSLTASALQLHPDVTAIIDKQASAQLAHIDYYNKVVEMTARLTPDRLGLG